MAKINKKYPYFSEDKKGKWKHYNEIYKILIEPNKDEYESIKIEEEPDKIEELEQRVKYLEQQIKQIIKQ